MLNASHNRNNKRAIALKKGRDRQANFRARQKEQNLERLQLRMSRYAHRHMRELAKRDNVSLTSIYHKAIQEADTNNPPQRHEPITQGDDIGTCPICPWVTPETFKKFGELAKHYKTTTTAISAIVYRYCLARL